MIDDRYELYRVVTDMDALQEALRDRVEDLDTTRTAIDEAGNLQPGYAGKLLCHPPIKSLGKDSLPKMLKATGMALVLVIDDERFAEVKAKLVKRRRPPVVRPNGSSRRPAWLITREKSRKMQDLRTLKVSEKKRQRIARKAGKASGAARRKKARERKQKEPRRTRSILGPEQHRSTDPFFGVNRAKPVSAFAPVPCATA